MYPAGPPLDKVAGAEGVDGGMDDIDDAWPPAFGLVGWVGCICVDPVGDGVLDDESEATTARSVCANLMASAFFRYTTCTLPGSVVG